MKPKEPSREDLLSSCSEVGPEDGVDPRYTVRSPRPRVKNRKALQLCAQVAETLREVLGGDCGDEQLRDLTVQSVVPAPNSSRLLVTLTLAPGSAGAETVRATSIAPAVGCAARSLPRSIASGCRCCCFRSMCRHDLV